MTASFHAAATGTYASSSATVTITLPATLTAGDLMITAITANYAVTSVATAHTTFTRLASAQDTANSGAICEVWYAYAAGTSGTSADASAVCTVTCGTASYPAVAFAAYSNAAVSSPIDSFGTDHTTSAGDVTTIPCTGTTTASANVLPVSCIGAGGASASPALTAPSGYTTRSSLSATYEAVAIADAAAISSSGTAYGSGSWTLGGGGGGATVTFGIEAASAATITAAGSIALAAPGAAGGAGAGNPVTSTGSIALAAAAIASPAATSTNPSWDSSGSYTLTFSDDFTTLNTSVWALGWGATSGISGPINAASSSANAGVDGEAAAYNSTAVSVSGSNLQLALTATPITSGGVTYPYTGACITSDPTTLGAGLGFQFTGGCTEARIYLPESTSGDLIANWPAFWTDGQTWPADGEIDIVEGLGGTAQWHSWTTGNDPGIGAAAPGQGDGTDVAYFSPYAGGWHTYGVSWNTTAGQIDYFFDGIHIGTIATGVTSSPMYLILDYTTGWQSGPELAATMLVDWVRVWSQPGTPQTIPPVSSLGDSFSSAATLQTLWCASSNVTVSGGQAAIETDPAYDGYLSSGTVYDLTGGTFSAKVTPPSGSVEVSMSLTDLAQDGGSSAVNSIDWYYNGTSLAAEITQAGTTTTVATLTYSATTHAYWKISESGGTITWSTSANGSSWTTQGTHTHTMSAVGLWAVIGAGNDGSGPLTTYVADVNGGSAGIGAVGSLALATPHPSGTGGPGGAAITAAGILHLATPSAHGTSGEPVTATGSLTLPALAILQPSTPPPLPSTPGLAQPGHTTPGDAGLGAPVIYAEGTVALVPLAAAGGPESQRLLMAFAF